MQKIGTFIQEMDALLMRKTAFVPAQAAGGGPQMQGQTQGLMQQVQQQLQQLPPEAQQQATQQLQQVQSLPPEQQQQALQQISQGLQQMTQQGAQGGQGQPQQGQPGQPQQQGQPGNPGAVSNQDGTANTNGHMEAENQLDNTKVTLSVRELMDITSKGGASEALFKVKQLAGQHNQKMQAQDQKMQQDQQQAQMDQQMQQQGMQAGAAGGGLYPQAPDMSGKSQTPTQPSQGGMM